MSVRNSHTPPSPATDHRPPATDEHQERPLGVATATLLVVASMIGTGIFTSTGYMVQDIPSLPAILIAWLIGGAVSLCGAWAYAELAACMPRNGGEYHILSQLFHPAIGFISAWTSLVVGFCAPIAVTALAFAAYLDRIIPGGYAGLGSSDASAWATTAISVSLVVALTAIHLLHVAHGSRFQNLFTLFKVSLLTILIIAGISQGDLSRITGDTRPIAAAMWTPTFAVGLFYIYYSYTGWNAAVYVAGEIRHPRRNLPIALALGTVIVTALYLGLNVVYLSAVPRAELAGVETVVYPAITGLFGESAARWVALLIVLGLVSMAGALIMTGSRVYEAVGQDFPRLGWLAARHPGRGPHAALLLQATIAILMIVLGDLRQLIEYVGFTLSLFSGLTVSGVFVLRRRSFDSSSMVRMPGYPVTSLVFIALMVWIVGVAIYQRPFVAVMGLGTLAVGGVLYGIVGRSTTRSAT